MRCAIHTALAFGTAPLPHFLGFRVNGGEGKVMGLASYGEPVYYDQMIADMITVREDGSFLMNLDYFAFSAIP